jgi:hypothetical protein
LMVLYFEPIPFVSQPLSFLIPLLRPFSLCLYLIQNQLTELFLLTFRIECLFFF